MAVIFSNVIVVHRSVPAATLAEFVKLARKEPGALTYGSSGIGGAGHLAGELLRIMAKIDIVHVPYKGGGRRRSACSAARSRRAFSRRGRPGRTSRRAMRALATAGAARDPHLADVPTVAEWGYPGYEATNWYAYLAPAKTPKHIVDRLNREIVKALGVREVRDLLAREGLEPRPSTPEELARYIGCEYETWGRVVKEVGINAQ